jgi:hypothetical protein
LEDRADCSNIKEYLVWWKNVMSLYINWSPAELRSFNFQGEHRRQLGFQTEKSSANTLRKVGAAVGSPGVSRKMDEVSRTLLWKKAPRNLGRRTSVNKKGSVVQSGFTKVHRVPTLVLNIPTFPQEETRDRPSC